jgi:hypothetical protein
LLSAAAAACLETFAQGASAAAPQTLLQAYVRLQHLRGAAGDGAGGGSAAAAAGALADAAGAASLALAPGGGALPRALEITTKVLAIVEAVGSAPAPTDAVAAGKLEQSVRAAMALLSQMPSANVELWARLARAAVGGGCWAAALACTEAAQAALPPALRGPALAEAESAAAALGLSRGDWFWLAVAEMEAGKVGACCTGAAYMRRSASHGVCVVYPRGVAQPNHSTETAVFAPLPALPAGAAGRPAPPRPRRRRAAGLAPRGRGAPRCRGAARGAGLRAAAGSM